MAQLSQFLGHNDDCLAMLRAALAALPRGANPLVRSELSAHQACAHARYRPLDASHTRGSVDAALESFEEADASAHTNWLLYMDRSEVNSLAASAYILLAQHESDRARVGRYAAKAEHYACQENEQRPRRRVRSRVFDEIRLSKVRLAQDEPAEAAAVAHNALRLATRVRSASAVTRLRGLGRALDSHGDIGEVKDFHTQLADYVRTLGKERSISV